MALYNENFTKSKYLVVFAVAFFRLILFVFEDCRKIIFVAHLTLCTIGFSKIDFYPLNICTFYQYIDYKSLCLLCEN